jgi:hypothetical protein
VKVDRIGAFLQLAAQGTMASLLIGCALVGCANSSPDTAVVVSQLDGVTPFAMQIVAHEDDDILFMNPDLQNFLGAGYGTVTVVMTAGEANGTVTDSQPGCPTPTPHESTFVFAHHRQDGMRAAYAHMAGLPDSWARSLPVINGREIEIDRLNGAPQIQLIFLNLPDEGDARIGGTDGCGTALNCLFHRIGDVSFPTITPVAIEPPPDDPVPVASDLGIPSYEYNREFVIADLVALLNLYQPSIVRTHDPYAYERLTGTGYAVSFDGLPHQATARFVDEALEQYSGPFGSGKFQTFYYRGYSLGNQLPNLGASERQRKMDTFNAYVGDAGITHDKNVAYFQCTQAQTGDTTGYLGWPRGIAERYPGSTTAMTNLPDGRLAMFAVMGRQLAWWFESPTGGGSWSGPSFLGGGPLAPSVTATTRTNGDVVVVGLQTPDTQHQISPPADSHLAIVYNVRDHGAGSWSGWTSLGNPDDGLLSATTCAGSSSTPLQVSAGRWLGTPAVAVDGGGNLVVAARDSCGHVSVRAQSGGSFLPTWRALSIPSAGAYDVIDGVAAVTANDGRVHVFAATMQGWIAHWIQSTVGSDAFSADTVGFPVGVSRGTAGPPTVTKNQDGRLEVFWRDQNTGDVVTQFERPAGGWGAVNLGNTGTGGTGPIAAIRRTSGHIMLFARNGFGGISTDWQGVANSSFVGWTDLQNQVPSFPSAASDAGGHAVVAMLDFQGRLQVRRETGGLGSFGPWTIVGGAPVTLPTTYYVSNGTNARDDNNGTSPSTPWATLHKVNSWVFSPGDRILLAKGSTWQGILVPCATVHCSGTADAPIKIDSYVDRVHPSTNPPRIDGAGSARATISLVNQSYWEIRDLEVTNHGPPGFHYSGIEAICDSSDPTMRVCHHIYIGHNHIHDINGLGSLDAQGQGRPPLDNGIWVTWNKFNSYYDGTNWISTSNYWDDVVLEANTLDHIVHKGILIGENTFILSCPVNHICPDFGYDCEIAKPRTTGVRVRNNVLTDIGGDGIEIGLTSGAVLEYNTLGRWGQTGDGPAVAGIWSYAALNTIIQHNEVYDGQPGIDRMAFDIDFGNVSAYVQYNYSHHNFGGMLLIEDICCGPGASLNFIDDPIARFNISRDDGANTSVVTAFGGGSPIGHWSSGANAFDFANNTIYQSAINYFTGQPNSTAVFGVSGLPNDSSCQNSLITGLAWIYNNIFYVDGSAVYPRFDFPGLKNNVFYPPANMRCAPLPGGQVTNVDDAAVTQNPLFVSFPAAPAVPDDVRLKAGSPALQNGFYTLYIGTVDYFGNAVTANPAPNRGAYNGSGL